MRVIDPKGKILELHRDTTPDFKRYLHSFGAIGIITELTMDIEPEYAVLKCIYEDVQWDSILGDADTQKSFMESHEYISMFTNYSERKMSSLWLGKRVDLDFYKASRE